LPIGPFAIYLNANARRVSPDVVGQIEELVPPDDIFFASTPQEGAQFARTILERRYPTVFAGGGDGTVVQLINQLWQASLARPERPRLPALGVLSLGTGNALSLLVSSGSPIQDLKTYVSNPSQDTWTISLVDVGGHLFPFASLGTDAELLKDYMDFKQQFGGGRLKPVFQNVGGYFVAFFGATAPRHIKGFVEGRTLSVRVTNLGPQAWRIGAEGAKGRPYGPGEVMYEGPVILTIAGTTPTFGYRMRVLPWADKHPDLFHLRVSNVPLAWCLLNLHKAWEGTFTAEGMHDFYASHVRMEYSRPVPFQVAGDVAGERETVEFRVVPEAVRLLRFL